jgi:hypothetical protein
MTIELTRKPASATNGGEFDASLAQTVPVTTLIARNTSGITIQNAALATIGTIGNTGACVFGQTGGSTQSHTFQGGADTTLAINSGSGNSDLLLKVGGVNNLQIASGAGVGGMLMGNGAGVTFASVTTGSAWTIGNSSGTSVLHTIQAHSQGGNALTLFNRATSDVGSGLIIKTNMSSGTFGAVLGYTNASNVVGGYVSHNTGANTVSYTNSSDARLKTLFESFGGLELIEQMEPKKYERLSDPGVKEIGFVAQELHEVFPQAVTVGGEDADTRPWGIDYGKLTPILVKAIQELKAELDDAKARLTVLEA